LASLTGHFLHRRTTSVSLHSITITG
jgi:hypothetical protein